MNLTYLLLNLGSIIVPFIFTFHPKLNFHKEWKFVLPAIIISMLPFIVWDIYFTDKGYWGFNENYLIGIYILDLPLEEWLFFITIPYACLFTHHSLFKIIHKDILNNRDLYMISISLLFISICLIIMNIDNSYTFWNFTFLIFILTIALFSIPNTLKNYYISFLIMLIPFFIVNGILTGTCIESPVVWYNDNENLGIRIATIPVEDIFYAFSLILLPLLISTMLKKASFDM